MNKVYLILGIYYEEDFYRHEAIEGANKTCQGAAKRLLELIHERPYEEYEIRKLNVDER